MTTKILNIKFLFTVNYGEAVSAKEALIDSGIIRSDDEIMERTETNYRSMAEEIKKKTEKI